MPSPRFLRVGAFDFSTLFHNLIKAFSSRRFLLNSRLPLLSFDSAPPHSRMLLTCHRFAPIKYPHLSPPQPPTGSGGAEILSCLYSLPTSYFPPRTFPHIPTAHSNDTNKVIDRRYISLLPFPMFRPHHPLTRPGSTSIFVLVPSSADLRAVGVSAFSSIPRDSRQRCIASQKSALVSPFPATLTDTVVRKPFVCHSYENTGGILPQPIIHSRFSPYSPLITRH